MMHEENGMEIIDRVVYIIDPQRRVQMHMTYPQNTGRNFHEIIRCLDSLIVTMHAEVCPSPSALFPPSIPPRPRFSCAFPPADVGSVAINE